ncbi:hypothetical protein F4860DRAFT_157665 [Xylaria cubensis]|nr:hypothetical protein F4860DRAFT_157665 [Xylaria cubensis]
MLCGGRALCYKMLELPLLSSSSSFFPFPIHRTMPSMAGTLGLHAYGLGSGLWEMPFAAPVATFLEDWFALQYLLPLISFVCVGLEGWCFFDLTRKSLGARSARAIADARDAASLEDYDVIKDFPRGGFEPCKLLRGVVPRGRGAVYVHVSIADANLIANNQLCVHGLLGIKLHAKHTDCPSTPVTARQGVKGLTMPCGCLIISKGRLSQTRRKRRREMSWIAI